MGLWSIRPPGALVGQVNLATILDVLDPNVDTPRGTGNQAQLAAVQTLTSILFAAKLDSVLHQRVRRILEHLKSKGQTDAIKQEASLGLFNLDKAKEQPRAEAVAAAQVASAGSKQVMLSYPWKVSQPRFGPLLPARIARARALLEWPVTAGGVFGPQYQDTMKVVKAWLEGEGFKVPSRISGRPFVRCTVAPSSPEVPTARPARVQNAQVWMDIDQMQGSILEAMAGKSSIAPAPPGGCCLRQCGRAGAAWGLGEVHGQGHGRYWRLLCPALPTGAVEDSACVVVGRTCRPRRGRRGCRRGAFYKAFCRRGGGDPSVPPPGVF